MKITMVDVMIRKTDDNDMYFSYLVALRCIFDKVDVADPVRNNAILKSWNVKGFITVYMVFYINVLYEWCDTCCF